ncbi:MAG TPA: hypothetical protein VN174_01670 [Candidatus Methanoperedens sp.]|nr:hypothetical protein [Candidatus Methanoperedens sp.]
MKKIKKVLPLLFLSILLSLSTYLFCYLIAEKYFFDKFFYQKSIAHGYIPENYNKSNHIDFGERSQDLETQSNFKLDDMEKTYTIVIFGDSYLWGQGVKNNQRFSHLLSKKLNKIRPTKILSLGKTGWNIVDYLNNYQSLSKTLNPNITIFSLVENDILVNKNDKSSPVYNQCLSTTQNYRPVFDSDFISQNDIHHLLNYESFITSAWNNPVNMCILNQSLSILPKDKSIYFITTDYFGNNFLYKKYQEFLINHSKYLLSTNINTLKLPKYIKYYNNIQKYFIISQKEGHPSALANQMYADILYNEITTNPQWEFTK